MKIWCRDFRDKFYTDAKMRDLALFQDIAFNFGRIIGEQFPSDATIEVRSKRAPTDFFKAGPYPVISLRLKELLQSFSVQGEFLLVKLVRKKDIPIEGVWYCFNAIEVADCFDRENSQFTPAKNYATKIERVAIREDTCGRSPLVLAQNTIPELLVVRDDVAHAISSAGCTGVLFKTPDEWRNPVNPV